MKVNTKSDTTTAVQHQLSYTTTAKDSFHGTGISLLQHFTTVTLSPGQNSYK